MLEGNSSGQKVLLKSESRFTLVPGFDHEGDIINSHCFLLVFNFSILHSHSMSYIVIVTRQIVKFFFFYFLDSFYTKISNYL